MLIHFGSHLSLFLKRRPIPRVEIGALWPGLITAACVAIAICTALTTGGKPAADSRDFDFSAAACIPVSYEGRVMPIDSLARNSLRIITGHSYVTTNDKQQIPALQWLLDVQARPERADDYKIFRVDYPDLLDLLGVDHSRNLFSFNEILNARDKLQEQLVKLQGIDPKNYDHFQKSLADLYEHLDLYLKLREVENLYLAPPLAPDQKWQTVEEVAQGKIERANMNPAIRSVLQLLAAYHQNDTATFNDTAHDYITFLKSKLPVMNRVQYEAWFNQVQPFTIAMVLYICILLLVFFSWIGWSPTFTRAAMWVLIATLIIHTAGLISRIYISGRPPVTNLYSASLFIAWAAAVMCLGLERIFRNGIGSFAAATIGFCSLIMAENLAVTSDGGDTMHQLRAVLATNFWLATHVVCVTLGYAATFLAGLLAMVYVIRGIFTRSLASDGGKEMYRMVYGIVCFAMLFSFVGTVLGGIWADQSWGRFWGWDPKENGAILIVVWNAMILHARWSGMAKARGVMSMAIFGNVVTAWSFFGTNMLGVGLHSYGFMDRAVSWLVAFVFLQLFLILISLTPLPWWRSFSTSNASV
jgi:ABC-type transport system involved in cytochrome c biogenesis permease subunit